MNADAKVFEINTNYVKFSSFFFRTGPDSTLRAVGYHGRKTGRERHDADAQSDLGMIPPGGRQPLVSVGTHGMSMLICTEYPGQRLVM